MTSGVERRRRQVPAVADACAAHRHAKADRPVSRFPGRTRPRFRGMIAGSARVPTTHVFSTPPPVWRSTACRSPTSPRASARRATSTAPASIRDGLPAARCRLRRLSARHSLRAQGQFDARHRAAAARTSAAASTPTRWAKSTSRCAAAFAPDQIMFTGVGKSADELDRARVARAQGHQRRVARRARSARSRWRRRAATSSRASRCASIPTSTRAAIRTSRPGSRPTSSASRSRPRRRSSARSAGAPGSWPSACTVTSARRSRRSIRWRAAPRPPSIWPSRSAPKAFRCGMSISAAGLGISYDGTPAIDPARVRPRARRARAADRADGAASSPAACWSVRPASC